MGSSSDASGNPMFLSRGTSPIPNLPVAGQGAPNDNPRNLGSFQSFLPDIPPAGQGPAPLARGLTAEMMQFKSPQGVTDPGQVDQLRQQLAALQTQVNSGSGSGSSSSGGSSGGNGQFGAAGDGASGLTAQQLLQMMQTPRS